jgi:hypothetical protein
MLHSSELCCTLLSYAAPFRATLHTTELGLTLNELHGTLKINGPRSLHGSFADPSDEINDIQRKPREISRNKGISSGPNSGCQGQFLPLYHQDLYRITPAKNNSMGPSVCPNFLFCFILFLLIYCNVPRPSHRSCADPYGVIGKKSAKLYHCLYSSTEQLQVAL